MYDAAFGPQADGDPNDPTGQLRHMGYLAQVHGDSSGSVGNTSNALVGQAQTQLNRLGFGPLEVDGILGPITSGALKRFYETRGQSWDGQVTQATVADLINASVTGKPGPQPTAPVPTAPADVPFYKKPTFIVLAVAGIGTAAYLLWRAGDIKGAFAGDEDEPEDDEGRAVRRGPGRPKGSKNRPKCAVGDNEPSWDSARPMKSLTDKLPPIPNAEPA